MKINKIKNILYKIKSELERETLETKTMLYIYSKATIGKASKEELKYASEQFKDLLKSVGFGTVLILPFAPVTIYLLIKLSKKFEIDLFPDWYKNNQNTNWDTLANNYSEQVFSLTKFHRHVKNILNEITDNSNILIIGAGSEVYLQKEIVKNFPNSKIVISDYSLKMLEESKRKFNCKNTFFELINIIDIPYINKFDYIISTNSILLEKKEDNDKVFKEIKKALKQNGKFISYLVSFDSVLNLCDQKEQLKKDLQLDIKNQSIFDSNEIQSFHTKNSILDNLQANNLEKIKLNKILLNKKDEVDELYRLYNIDKKLLEQIYQYFIVASKP